VQLTVLGSGTAISRSNSAGFLLKENDYFLFDLGSGSFCSLKKLDALNKLKYVFFTHFHPDHCHDLMSFLSYFYLKKRFKYGKTQKKVFLFGPEGLKEYFEQLLLIYPSFKKVEKYVKLRELKKSKLNFNKIKIFSFPVKHSDLNALGYRVESNKVFAYSGDTNYCRNLIELGKNADLLLLECSYSEKLWNKRRDHLHPELCAKIARECNAKKLMLSHIYPMTKKEKIKPLVKKKFKGKIVVARDLMKLTI
jgi:ribonuclease BN (tRNA processing enzyme)